MKKYKVEIFCYSCDEDSTIVTETKMQPKFCPFCGDELEEDNSSEEEIELLESEED